MERVVKTAQIVAAGSSEISGAVQDLSSRTEQQAVKVEVTVNALHEIGNTMAQAPRSTRTANAMVEQTRKSAEQSADVAARAVEAVGGARSILSRNFELHQRNRRHCISDRPAGAQRRVEAARTG